MKTPKTPPSLIKSTSQEKSDTPIVSVSASKNQEGFPQSSKYSLRGTARFKPFRKGNGCPVCGREDSACRYSLEDQNFIQCFTFADARKRELINGYVCVKEAFGHTASFVPDNSDDWNSERLQQLRQERQARIAEQQARNNAALSLAERNKATRQLHYCLGLSASHRQNLRNRGLSDAQIDAGYFFSVLPNADLPLGIPANYPGVRDGKLSVSGSGFACPTWTVDGLISGWQVRLDNESEGRYRWAKSIASSHLPNGELPITIVRPDEIKHNWVADIEGILKPYIAAKRLGAICLGAAGGNVTSSPEQIKDAIAKLNITQIIDFPDAGDILNHQVMRRRLAKYKLYKSLGLQVEIAWWGQITKEESDIDELESLEGIRYISIEEFVAISQKLKVSPDRLSRAYGIGGATQTQTQTRVAQNLKTLPKKEIQQKLTPLEKEELQLEQLDRCDINEEFLHSFQAAAAKLKSLIFGTLKNSKHFVPAPPSRKDVPVVTKVTVSVDYVPGELPTFEQHKEILKAGISPIYEFPPSLHSVVWQEAVAKGWKHILDNTSTGLGKSHKAGLANPDDYKDTKQLWYFAADHTNPTTLTVETGWTNLVSRNDGMRIDNTRQTPSGKDYLVWPKDGEKKDTAGNCDYTPMFRTLASLNIRDIEVSANNPICQGCRHFKEYVDVGGDKKVPKCLAESGPGFGYRGQRRDILASPKIRAHITSAPQPREELVAQEEDGQQTLFQEQGNGSADQERGYDYSTSGAFWDEASTLIGVSKTIDVRQVDLAKAHWEIRTKLPEFNSVLQPVWDALGSLIEPMNPNYIDEHSRYGMSNAKIRNLLPEVPEEIDYIIAKARIATEPDLDFLNDDVKVRKLSDVPLNWFVPFLEAWKDNSGYFQCNYGSILSITTRELRHAEIAKAMKFNIYLDATHSPDLLALELDINRSELLNIRAALPDHSNLQIHQVTGMGKLGKNRSANLEERTDAIKTELEKRHPGKLGTLEWKAQAKEEEGYHFRDGRGINRYKECEALAAFGVPYPNIGALAIRYQLLTGISVDLESETEDPDFQAYVKHYVNAEIVQEVGRLRAHLRSGQKLVFYFVADYDISWLNAYCPGAEINQIDAFALNHKAGSSVQKVRAAIMDAAMKLRSSLGKNPTQEQVAAESGIKRGTIARIASEFGGWKTLLKLFTLLYKSLYSKVNNLNKPPDDAPPMESDDLAFLAKQYLPLLVEEHRDDPSKLCEELLVVQGAHGQSGAAAIFKAATFEVLMQIFTIFTQLLPDWMREQFLEGLHFDDWR